MLLRAFVILRKEGTTMSRKFLWVLLAACILLSGCGSPVSPPASSLAPSSSSSLPSKVTLPEPSSSTPAVGLTEEGTPGAAVLGCVDALKRLDLEEMAHYAPDGVDVEEFKTGLDLDSNEAKLLLLLFQRVEFEVTDSLISQGDTAAVITLKITNVDMEDVVEESQAQVILWALEYTSSQGEEPTDEEIEEKLLEIVQEAVLSSDKTETQTVKIALSRKENGQWAVINLSQELLSAMLGGVVVDD